MPHTGGRGRCRPASTPLIRKWEAFFLLRLPFHKSRQTSGIRNYRGRPEEQLLYLARALSADSSDLSQDPLTYRHFSDQSQEDYLCLLI